MKLVQLFLCLVLITIFEPMNVNGTFFEILEDAGSLFGFGKDHHHDDVCKCPPPSCPPCPNTPNHHTPPNPPTQHKHVCHKCEHHSKHPPNNPWPAPPNYPSWPQNPPNPYPSPPNPYSYPPNPNPYPYVPNQWPFPPNYPPAPYVPPPASPPVNTPPDSHPCPGHSSCSHPCRHPCGESRGSEKVIKESSTQQSEHAEKSLIQPLSGLDSKPNLNNQSGLNPPPKKHALRVKDRAVTAATSPPEMNVTMHHDTTGASKEN